MSWTGNGPLLLSGSITCLGKDTDLVLYHQLNHGSGLKLIIFLR